MKTGFRVAASQQQSLTCPWPHCSHDFIGEFTTSYRELSKAQNQFTVYEVRAQPHPGFQASTQVCSAYASLPLCPTVPTAFAHSRYLTLGRNVRRRNICNSGTVSTPRALALCRSFCFCPQNIGTHSMTTR